MKNQFTKEEVDTNLVINRVILIGLVVLLGIILKVADNQSERIDELELILKTTNNVQASQENRISELESSLDTLQISSNEHDDQLWIYSSQIEDLYDRTMELETKFEEVSAQKLFVTPNE